MFSLKLLKGWTELEQKSEDGQNISITQINLPLIKQEECGSNTQNFGQPLKFFKCWPWLLYSSVLIVFTASLLRKILEILNQTLISISRCEFFLFCYELIITSLIHLCVTCSFNFIEPGYLIFLSLPTQLSRKLISFNQCHPYLSMESEIKTFSTYGLNEVFCSKFLEGLQLERQTHERSWKYNSWHCEYNHQVILSTSQNKDCFIVL